MTALLHALLPSRPAGPDHRAVFAAFAGHVHGLLLRRRAVR